MVIPGEVEDKNEEPIEGNASELKLVDSTEGVKKEEGEPLTEVPINEEKWTGQTEVKPEVAEEMNARIDARETEETEQNKFDTAAREFKRDDARERSWLRKLLGLKNKE